MGKISRDINSKITHYQNGFIPMKLKSNLKRKNKSFLFIHVVSYPISGEPCKIPASLKSHIQFPSFTSFLCLLLRPGLQMASAWDFQSLFLPLMLYHPASLPCHVLYTRCSRASASLSSARWWQYFPGFPPSAG